MANVVIDDTHLSDIAAAIREKNGLTDTYKPSEMAAAIQAITTSSGDPDTPGDDPIVSTIDFDDYIGRSLSGEVEFACTRIGRYGLAGCNYVTKFTVDGDGCGVSAFVGCSSLQELSLPNATEFGTECCYKLTKLATVNAPQAVTINDNAFTACSALTTITLGDVKVVGDEAFKECTALTKIDFGAHEQAHSYYSMYHGAKLGGDIFSYCDNLTAIIFRGNEVPLAQSYASPFPDHFKASYSGLLEPGYIYVPRDMIETYQTYNGNTSGLYPYYDHFSMMNYRAIEDYPEICG